MLTTKEDFGMNNGFIYFLKSTLSSRSHRENIVSLASWLKQAGFKPLTAANLAIIYYDLWNSSYQFYNTSMKEPLFSLTKQWIYFTFFDNINANCREWNLLCQHFNMPTIHFYLLSKTWYELINKRKYIVTITNRQQT